MTEWLARLERHQALADESWFPTTEQDQEKLREFRHRLLDVTQTPGADVISHLRSGQAFPFLVYTFFLLIINQNNIVSLA